MDARGWNFITRECIANEAAGFVRIGASGQRVIDDIDIAVAVEGLRKIAGALQRCRNRRQHLVRAALAGAFVIGVEEGAIALYLAARRGARFVALEEAFCHVLALVLPTLGV